ncbi:hypothetical protein [Pannonibacter tanglangensis]|uniref:Uncharacterized protein n=1 Tax=Pannonibacter tanglangensis TaxID=2750084 RepID=A0ABW9ZDR3_9HYPH|nr:hypothetical protein [Pannonibacter sp. XCT-34]NBN62975.1 hypothetical protein [Pannonibacter sp. XCT-34]
MISLIDCIALSGLDEAEVRALAEHEHLPDIAAAALGAYLLHLPHGPERVQRMIEEDIRAALERSDRAHARDLFMALRHFLKEHGPQGSRRHA